MTLIHKCCSVCQSPLTCGVPAGKMACWCDELPYIMPADFEMDCRCRPCLIIAIKQRIEDTINKHDLASLLPIARPFFKPDSLVEDIDYTVEQGQYVFSQWYHLKRGACCQNGCRNCPY